MTSPGGPEVGRVSVRVVPDTSGFDREMKSLLAKWDSKSIEIGVDFDVDDAALTRKLEALRVKSIQIPAEVKISRAQITEQLNTATTGLKGRPIQLDVRLNRSTVQRIVREATAGINVPKIPLDVELTRGKVTAALQFATANQKAPPVELAVQVSRGQVAAAVRAATANMQAGSVNVEAKFDRAQIRTALDTATAGLKGAKVPVDVEFDKAQIQARATAAMSGIRVKADGTIDFDRVQVRAALQRAILGMRPINVPVNFDANPIQKKLKQVFTGGNGGTRGGIFEGITDMFQGLPDLVAGVLGGLTRVAGAAVSVGVALAQVGSNVGTLSSQMANLGTALVGAFVTGITAAAQLAIGLVALGAVAIALAAAGAAITAAFATVSTAIVALPGLIGALAIPILTVLAGMDGIKKAAQTMKPEFEALKTAVSNTFEKGLTPVFERLDDIFPKITKNLQGVAQAIVGVADNLTRMVTSEAGVRLIQQALDNMGAAITKMTPGITGLVDGFLRLTAMKETTDLLANAVNALGVGFDTLVQQLSGNGTLQAAFKELDGLIQALIGLFLSLVKDGIQAFVAAGPGITSLIKEIGGFLDRFDWNALGKSVGGVFQGLADTIKQIPQGTIDAIQASFQKLADTFQSPGFQEGLQIFIGLIPSAIGFIDLLAQAFSRTAIVVSGAADVFSGSVKSIVLALQALAGDDPLLLFRDSFKRDLDAANEQAKTGLEQIKRGFAEFKPTIPPGTIADPIKEEMGTVSSAGDEGMRKLKESIEKGLVDAKTASVAGAKVTGSATVQAVGDALKPMPEVAKGSVSGTHSAIVQEILDAERDSKTHADGVPRVIAQGLGGTPEAAAAAVAPTAPAVNAELAPLAQLEAVKNMEPQFTIAAAAAMHALSVGVQSGMAEVQAAFKTGLDSAASGMAGSFRLMDDNLAIQMASLVKSVQTGMVNISTALDFTIIQQSIATAMLGLVTNVSNGMANVVLAVTTKMAEITAAFNFAGIQLQVATVFLGLVTNVSNGMANMALAVTTGMAAVIAAFNFEGLQLSVATLFLGLVQNTANGMANMALAVTTGMVAVKAAFNFEGLSLSVATLFLDLVQNTANGMSNMALAVTNGMNTIRSAFDFSSINQSVASAFLGIVQNVSNGMQNATSAVENGANNMKAAITRGMAEMQASVANSMRAMDSAIASAMSAMQANVAKAASAVAQSMSSMAQAVTSAVQTCTTQFKAFGDAATQAASTMQTACNAIINSANQMASGVQTAMRNVVTAVQNGVRDAVAAANAGAAQMRAAGENMGQALADGLNSKLGAVQAAAQALANAAAAATAAAAQINSPSRVFTDLGEMMGLGLANGIMAMISAVKSAAASLVDEAVDQLGGAGSTIGGSVAVNAEPYLNDWSQLVAGVSTSSASTAAATPSSLVGNMVVNTPYGVSPQEMMDQALFQLRHVRRGVYSGR